MALGELMTKQDGSHLYVGLADSLQGLIEKDSLRAGQRVPSIRTMARQRSLSVATVVQAYGVLEDRGFIEPRAKSGYYVKPRPLTMMPAPRTARPTSKPSYVNINELTAHVMELATDPTYFPLGGGCPDPQLFPIKKLARVTGSVCRDDPAIIGRYAMNWSYEPLAREISRRYLQTGTPLAHDEIVVTHGCTEAINLALRAVTKPGDTIVVETPVYFGFLQIISHLGLRALEVPADAKEGIDLVALKTALTDNNVKAVLTMPNFQNPLGSCMSDERKGALYNLLADFGVPAIEDDIYADLHYGQTRPKPLKAWDRDGLVLLCSSVGKTLAPGLRVGWIAPGRYFDQVRRLKLSNTLGTSTLLQKVITQFLRGGGYDHHLRSIRHAYRSQLTAVSRAVQNYFPLGTRLTQPQGGFLLWAELPQSINTLVLHADAVREKIGTAPGPLFSARERYYNCIRLNCGIPWSTQLDQSLKTLGGLMHKQIRASA